VDLDLVPDRRDRGNPLTDYLSRVFSFRRYMLASAALFAAFSVACAFTTNLPSMIAMRDYRDSRRRAVPMAFTLVLTKLPKPQQPIGSPSLRCPSPLRPRSDPPSAAI